LHFWGGQVSRVPSVSKATGTTKFAASAKLLSPKGLR
jgi:hypothetical protein